MINIIYSEFLKLKKSSYMLLILAGALTMPAIMNIAFFISQDKNITFDSYAYNINSISSFVMYGILFSIISGYVFSREYSDKTASTLYSYQCSRIKIFIGKLVVIYVAVCFVYLIQCISVYIGYYELFGAVERDVLINDIKANIYSLLCQMMIIPIPVLLANIKKNIIVPLLFGIVQLSMLLLWGNSELQYIEYFPLLSPYLIFQSFYIDHGINIQHIIVSGFICFLVFISLAIYEHNKTDIV